MSVKKVVQAPVVLCLRLEDRWAARRHELAVCAIFREEAPFLDEWIRFHRGVGVDHFFLYNNFSTDDFTAAISSHVEAGYVTLTDWPVPVGQLAAYRDCVARFRHQVKWLAFFDIDEFLFSPTAVDIRPILSRFGQLPGLGVHAAFFGSSGQETRSSRRVVETYTRRAPLTMRTAKTITRPRWVRRVGVHMPKYWGDTLTLDTSLRPVTDDANGTWDLLRINHYWSRSLEDLRTKIARGDASTPNVRRSDWHFRFEAGLNAEEDRTILPIAGRIFAPVPIETKVL
jgi:hypothetical protein